MASSKKRRHADLTQHLAGFLQRHISPGSRVLLGFSGGLDSRVLLDLLARSPSPPGFSLAALHVNHGISPHAAAWVDFCRTVCEADHVAFTTVNVVVPRNSGLGLEAAARAVRYSALCAQAADYVVLAHHLNDQAETLLQQLLRGAGVKGLAAMGETRREGEHTILRPLLEVPRDTLLEYAQAHGLQWIEDESNLDLTYDRNFLRHQVLPILEERFPASRVTLARSAAHLAEAAALLEEVAVNDALQWVEGDKLDLKGVSTLSFPRAKNLLRYWLSRFGIDTLPSATLAEVMRQRFDARQDAQVSFRLTAGSTNYQLRRYRQHAWIVAPSHDSSATFPINWDAASALLLDGMGSLSLRQTKGEGVCSRKLADARLTVRLRQGGERLQPDCNRPTRSLKSLLQESAIPPWQRASLPLLYCGEALIAVPGIGIACTWQAAPDDQGLLPVWIPS